MDAGRVPEGARISVGNAPDRKTLRSALEMLAVLIRVGVDSGMGGTVVDEGIQSGESE